MWKKMLMIEESYGEYYRIRENTILSGTDGIRDRIRVPECIS